MTIKDERIKELERQVGLGETAMIFIVILAFIPIGFMIYYSERAWEFEQQLQSCQEKVPIRESVLFYKCEDETLKNILIDENNKSIYDYNIKEGCEVIK